MAEISDERTNKNIPVEEILWQVGWEGEDTDISSFLSHRASAISNGSEDVYFFISSCGVYYHQQNDHFTLYDHQPVSWQQYLKAWDYDDYGDFVSLLASFRLSAKDYLDEADENYIGECKVWTEYFYYDGTLSAPYDRWALDEETHEPLFFSNYQAAQAWVEEQEGGTYYLSHGEYDPPIYTICKA